MKVAISAGHNTSLHTIALMHDLLEAGHEITGCLQVKELNIKRIIKYIRQYGLETVKAKFDTHVLRSKNTYLSGEIIPVSEYLQSKNIDRYKTISSFCRCFKINRIAVNSLNSRSRWIDENPLRKKDSYLDSWSPYSVSLRIVTWIKAYCLTGNKFPAGFLDKFYKSSLE